VQGLPAENVLEIGTVYFRLPPICCILLDHLEQGYTSRILILICQLSVLLPHFGKQRRDLSFCVFECVHLCIP
jgi:hypothetical protein